MGVQAYRRSRSACAAFPSFADPSCGLQTDRAADMDQVELQE
jgi:hypothetical protein